MRMESIQRRVESWIRDQRAKMLRVSWGPLQWRLRWPPWDVGDAERRKTIQQEYERRKKQLQDLCRAVKAESVSELQDILCCMVLSECVYKRPASEMVRAVNKFKADFGGQVVSLERVQPSSDHVPHRYLLAEAGDTLFASFVGTKQYKDVMADANILQGNIFREDAVEVAECTAPVDSNQGGWPRDGETQKIPLESKTRQLKPKAKPAAHRGFLARAKGIPALELYRLAQKKKQKLVLCGHSLGGAVAALATLAILRVVAVSSMQRENEKVQVKCITFSQPPVGNAALRDYVHEKGWQHYFKSYCIPEDLVPRILSPAYFHHYNAQPVSKYGEFETADQSGLNRDEQGRKAGSENLKGKEGEQLVLGVGPIQNSFWRLSNLVPLEGVRRHLNKFGRRKVDPAEDSASNDSLVSTSDEDIVVEPQSLEIQEGTDGISLKPLPGDGDEPKTIGGSVGNSHSPYGDGRRWRRVPYLPSYVPFGQLYLLGTSSVESFSGAEYSKLTSVRSVIAELKERFQSHSMRSYRSRFQRIYDLCTNKDSLFGIEQQQDFPHLQQWLGIAVGGSVELGHIVESPLIRTATSIVPLGWSGVPGDRNAEPLKVDITGFGLHLCTLVHAQVNGNWCSTTVESFPAAPVYSANHAEHSEVQRIRVHVGPPLRQPPKHQIVADSLITGLSSPDSDADTLENGKDSDSFQEDKFVRSVGLDNFLIFCTSDFSTVSKEVHVRIRRVRLLGLEGAGKTSLFRAIMGQCMLNPMTGAENPQVEMDVQEGIAGGVCYMDAMGVNLQELALEVSRFRDELWKGVRDLSKKTDLIVLVHNLSHRIPRCTSASQQQPAVSLLLDEAKALGIPWVLAITNKFSVSAHQQNAAINSVLQAYKASPSTTEVINSIPYVIPSSGITSLPWAAVNADNARMSAPRLLLAPLNLVRRPFQKRDTIFPMEGVESLCQLVHRVLKSQEEASLQEFARDRLVVELARDHAGAIKGSKDSKGKTSMTAAAVGASFGAGLGLVLAVVMGAASALRKP